MMKFFLAKIKSLISKVWNGYVNFLLRIFKDLPDKIIVAAISILGMMLTLFLAMVGFFYKEYISNERQIYYLQKVVLEQERQLEGYSKLAELIQKFNSYYSNRYGSFDPNTNLITIQRQVNDVRESPIYENKLDNIINEFNQTIALIDKTNSKLEQLESHIRKPWIVKPGDTHERVVEKFFKNEVGLSKKETLDIIDRIALTWELEPGNYIYNVYYDGIFLTTVTQGEASISPSKAQARIRNAYQKKIKEYEAEIVRLRSEIQNTKRSSISEPDSNLSGDENP